MKKFLLLFIPIFIVGILFAAPLNEGFESPNCPASDWTIMYANPSPPSGNLMTHSTDYYYEGSRSFRFSSFSSGSPYDQYLITPQLVVNSGDQTVSFYYRRYSSYTSETFRVGWSSTGTEIDNFTWSSDITNASTTWQQYSKNDLPVGTKYVAVHYKSNYAYYLYIDKFVGPEQWTSPTPPNPAINPSPADAATNVQKNVTLSWSSGGGAPTAYDVYFGTSSPPPLVSSLQTETTYNPGTLQYSTTYYWKVDPHNEYGYASDITTLPVWSFTTMADPTIYPPFTEGFEYSGALPNGWNVTHGTGGTYNWECVTTDSHGPSAAHNGSYFARLNVYNASTSYNPYCLITPPIDLSSGNIRLNYWVWLGSTGSSTPLDIEISTDNQITWTNLFIHNLTTTNSWFNNIIPLTDYTSSNAYIRFKGTSNYGSGSCNMGLDDITFEPIPEEPIITVNPESWDFGTVLLGASATKQFTISNTGGGRLHINSVDIAGDFYNISEQITDTDLDANESTNFTVVYEPNAESKGIHEGSVIIQYDGGETTIPLTGTCVDATIYAEDLTYSQNFDGVTAPALPLGWTSFINSTSTFAAVQTYTSSTPYSVPNHIYIYNSSDTNAKLILISPMIDVPLNTLRTSFYAKGSSGYTLNLGTMSDPTNDATFTSFATINLTSTYTKYTINLNSYTGSDQYLAFKHGLGGTYRSIYLDDFLLELVPSVIEPSNLTVSNITEDSAVLGWTENNVPPATTWDIIYGEPGFDPNAKATLIAGITSNPYTLTGLQPSTTYEWYVRTVKDGNPSVWVGPSSFTTTQIPAELPFTENFDGEINWTIVNGTQPNQWFVGVVPAYDGNSAYISKDGGTTYEYNNGSTSVVHLYRDIEFIAGALEYNLSFMLKCGGESSYDGLKVFLVDTATIPAAGTQLTTGQIGNPWYNLTTDWTAKTITIGNAVAGSTKRLVFSWRNDGYGGTQPPAAIDNIELTYTMPSPNPEPATNPVPADLATDVPLNQILSWTNNGTVTKVDVYFGLSGNMVLVSENQTDPLNSYDPELEYSKTYQWKIVAKNDAEETAEGPVWSFTTIADPTRPIPYLETFNESTNLPANWTGTFSIDPIHGVSSNGLCKNLWSSSTSAYVTTPPIGPLTDNTTLQFDYRYVEYNNPADAHPLVDGDKLEIQISTDGTNFTTIHTIDSSNHITSNSFATCSVPITQAKVSQGDIIKAKFLATWGAGDYYLDIDNVYFKHISSEPVFSITPESKAFGELQINTVSSAQVFTIKNDGGGTLTINPAIELIGANADQFQLTDINSYPCELETDETMTVSVTFAPTSIGEKSASLKIVDNLSKTEHNISLTGTGADYTIYTIPYMQGFNAVIFPPLGWKNEKISGTGSGLWDRVTSGSYPSCTPHSGAGMARFNAFSMSDGTHGILVTSPVQFESEQYYIDFWMYRDSGYPNKQDEGIKVYINTTPSLTGATVIAYIHRPITLEPVVESSGWYEYNYTLENIAGTKYFIFEGISNFGNNIFIDDIRILKQDTQINQGTASGGNVSIVIPPVHSISPTIVISELGQSDATVTVIAGYADVALPNAGLSLTLTGTSFSGATITIAHNLGFNPEQIAYRIEPGTWNILTSLSSEVTNWDETQVTFTPSAKADGDLGIVFPAEEGQTLPVTLSNFTAVVTSENFVNIAWMAETETNHSGYNILRNEEKDLENAIKINDQLIDKGTAVGTQISYFYTDFEVYTNQVYYYWLESVALDGTNQFYGPLTVIIGDPTQEPVPPSIPMVTKLYNAFPNPFNPNTNIRYSLKEAGKVKIEIYNMKGQKIKSYNQEHASPGYYQVSWDGRDENGKNVASGIYLYRLTTANYTSAKKMVLAK